MDRFKRVAGVISLISLLLCSVICERCLAESKERKAAAKNDLQPDLLKLRGELDERKNEIMKLPDVEKLKKELKK